MSELVRLEKMLRSGKMSRRSFIAQASALGFAALIPSSLLSAATSTPKRGGRFRVGISSGSSSGTLNLSMTEDTMASFINRGQIRNYLLEINHKSEFVPELAESWEPASRDAKKWVFNLRKGVQFHNGKTFDADDVIYSMNIHMGDDSKSGAKPYVEHISEMKKDGNHRLIMTLKSGIADFPYYFAASTQLPIVQAGSDPADGNGTGPYVLKDWEPGIRSLTTRNPNYWREDRAWFDEVETLLIADPTARTNALQTGQVDAIENCDLKTVQFLERAPGIEVLRVPGTYHRYWEMNVTTPPYDNNDVRLALKYAIDREEILEKVLSGYGAIANDHPIPSTMIYFDSSLPQRQYDPDKAKYHLKKAGLQNPTFKIHGADGAWPGAIDAALIYKENAAKAGITLDVVREPNDGFWSDVWCKKPFCATWMGGRTTPDMVYSTMYAPDIPWNCVHWNNPRFNELLYKARAELDHNKRKTMYAEMQGLVHNEYGAIIPFFVDSVDARSKKIAHGPIAGNIPLDGWRCTERWWFS
jgi:peptide/nickel transport system substrate-binding protein